jgi:hypothetical protein
MGSLEAVQVAVAGPAPPNVKKAGVVEHLEVFDHPGLLVNEPPADGVLLFESSSGSTNSPFCYKDHNYESERRKMLLPGTRAQ